MKRVPIILLLLAISCAPKSINTEVGRNAWYANQVAIRINELSATVIQLNQAGVISDSDTRTFGNWATVALKTLDQIPNGWQKTIQTGWFETKAKLPPSLFEDRKVQIGVAVLEALIQALNPQEVPK